ncbi:MAG: hypothetical protein VYA60_07590 [Pseudomonadota bacterium]|nr:hypothetical protein [Pseudomonadota bacterium]
MLALILDEVAAEQEALPAPAVAAISAGTHISTQEIKDLTASDVDKSLTPAPSNAPMFERGGYLNPEPTKTWVDGTRKEDSKKEVIDVDTRSYLIKMHRAAANFIKALNNNHAIKKAPKKSLDDLKNSQKLMKRYATRFAILSQISTRRLEERASDIAPAIVAEAKSDTKDLNDKMDTYFKDSIKSGDLQLNTKDSNRLGDAMDNSEKSLASIDKILDKNNTLSQENVASNNNPSRFDSDSSPSMQ